MLIEVLKRTLQGAACVVVAGTSGFLSANCAGQPGNVDSDGARMPACRPAEVTFAQATDPTHARQFESCNLTTEAEFLGTGWGTISPEPIEGWVTWSAAAPGSSDPKLLYITVPKSKILASLKVRDRVKILGSATVSRAGETRFFAAEVLALAPSP